MLFAAALMTMTSCGIQEIGGEGKDPAGGGIWGGPVSGGQGGSGGLHTVCYMTALDYKKGYDWRSDQARETVKCSLVVFADGVPVMKVPVGTDYGPIRICTESQEAIFILTILLTLRPLSKGMGCSSSDIVARSPFTVWK